MSRKNRRNAVLVIEADELPEGWEVARSTIPRADNPIMHTKVHGLQGKDKTRADRRARKQRDRSSVDIGDLKESRYV